jgi:hypothetical protein
MLTVATRVSQEVIDRLHQNARLAKASDKIGQERPTVTAYKGLGAALRLRLEQE